MQILMSIRTSERHRLQQTVGPTFLWQSSQQSVMFSPGQSVNVTVFGVK